MMFSCLFVCLSVFVLDEVSSHSYCRGLNCHDDKCLRTGECLDGCVHGFLLDGHRRCVRACAPNCRTCGGYDQCVECEDSYFGEHCELICSEGCQQSVCDKDSGNCTFGCIPDRGFATEKCEYTGLPEGEVFIFICTGVAASLILIVVIAVIVVQLHRRRSKHIYTHVKEYIEEHDHNNV